MDITVTDHNGAHQTDEFFIDEPCVASFFIGELGWLAQRWQGYLRHLKHNIFPEHKFFVMLNGQYHILVEDLVNWTVDLPEEFYKLNLETDCYEAPLPGSPAGTLTPTEVWTNLIEYMRQFYNVEKSTELWTPRGVNMWVDMQPQLFTKYTTEALVQSKRPIITVFPRGRTRAAQRNVPEFVWHEVVEGLRQTFDVVLCGTPTGACMVNYQAPGVDNLIGKAGLDQVLFLLNNSVCSISSQSGPTHLSVLSMCPSYIIGHEQKRHTVDDNRFVTPTSFRYLEDYRAIDAQTILQDVDGFVQLLQQNDEFNSIARRTLKPATRYVAGTNKKDLVGAILNYQDMPNVGNILNLLDFKKLYLVGPTPEGEDSIELTARLSEYVNTDKVFFISEPIETAIDKISEDLDFVYTDTTIPEEVCMNWFYKLKPEGVFGSGDLNTWTSTMQFPFRYRRTYQGVECDKFSRYGERVEDTGWFLIQGGPLRDSLRMFKGKKNLVGAEIGVFFGENSKAILDNLNMKTLYLIDPYDQGLVGIEEQEAPQYILGHAKRLLEPHSDKIIWVKQHSEEAAASIKGKLDFVYVDGDHTYEGAYKDFERYWPKIKKGGILGGHDFDNKEVAKAAADFFDTQPGEQIFFTGVDQDGTIEFWVYKIDNIIEHAVTEGIKDFDKLIKQRVKDNA